MNLWRTARCGGLTLDNADVDVGTQEDDVGDVEDLDDEVPQTNDPEGNTIVAAVINRDRPEWLISDLYPERLIISKDSHYPSKFSRFYACDWQTGHMYAFSPAQGELPKHIPLSPDCSPTTRMKQQVYVGIENMKSTHRVLSIFQNHTGDEETTNGTAFAVSQHMLLTAGHMLSLVTFKDGKTMKWQLKEVLVYAGEFVPIQKVREFGFRCTVQGNATSVYSTRKECPELGSDIALLKVEGTTLPCFLLPSSPQKDLPLTVFGYPDAVGYLRRATRELKQSANPENGGLWSVYWRVLWDNIQEWTSQYEGDLKRAEETAKKWLLEQFQTVLRGIPDGAQCVSAGFAEALTSCFVGHTCPTVPGVSGGAISPMESPGYFVAAHAGALDINQNCGTSTDNPAFVDQYLKFVLQDLPTPEWALYTRADFSIRPFLAWLHTHKAMLPPSSPWVKHLQQQLMVVPANEQQVERPSKRRKLEDTLFNR
ncbi:hypothetical protein SELMODRAFT_426786 [Selaginella moellendorffii]|uniref:Peptidase S1 domain-containing protein n=1 Tax=Selaginella moellendorffii TaxID=88036 RepID=D8SXH4_SELML|nr:uncharacterized protein LOC9657486 [Selaginella moellendorffii]EFJ10888.1 hypothetical protein SELMODRAFT_426786 [Selaginella moellendorffii]|eukprot:XP_002988096.1 uncharacterized protein LOC9657486 [Selaginella moellendorffii]